MCVIARTLNAINCATTIAVNVPVKALSEIEQRQSGAVSYKGVKSSRKGSG